MARVLTPEIGKRYGRLVILGSVLHPRADGRQRLAIVVRCDCGTEKEVAHANLLSGNTTSCGCFHRERASAANRTHGDANRTRLYRIWKAMHERCENPNAQNWRWYGGKGVKVCKAWQSFEVFRSWAADHGYEEGLQLDRVDADKDYKPSNCRWITKRENIKNAQRGLPADIDDRLRRYCARYRLTTNQVVEEALRAFLPE